MKKLLLLITIANPLILFAPPKETSSKQIISDRALHRMHQRHGVKFIAIHSYKLPSPKETKPSEHVEPLSNNFRDAIERTIASHVNNLQALTQKFDAEVEEKKTQNNKENSLQAIAGAKLLMALSNRL